MYGTESDVRRRICACRDLALYRKVVEVIELHGLKCEISCVKVKPEQHLIFILPPTPLTRNHDFMLTKDLMP